MVRQGVSHDLEAVYSLKSKFRPSRVTLMTCLESSIGWDENHRDDVLGMW